MKSRFSLNIGARVANEISQVFGHDNSGYASPGHVLAGREKAFTILIRDEEGQVKLVWYFE